MSFGYYIGTQMASVTTSAASIDSYSTTLPSSYRQKSNGIHQFTDSSIVPNNGPHCPSESSFYSLRNKRHSVKTSHIDTKAVSTGVNSFTVTTRPKLSTSTGISKSTSMPKFYKEMVPLSRKALNNSDNVRTKIQQFEGINTTKKEKDDKACELTSVASEVRELKSSPQHCSKVRRSGTWNFHSPAPLQKQPSSIQGAGGTRKSNGHTHFTFQCPKVKSEVVHR